jgi:hypothetical protein
LKQFKTILISLLVGLLVGLALGVNIGRDKPLLSNPFAQESLAERIKRLSGETLEHGGKALENTGQALQDKLKNP